MSFLVSIVYCLGSDIELLSALLVTAVCQDSKALRVLCITSALDCYRAREIIDVVMSPRMFCHIRYFLAIFHVSQVF